MPDVDIDFFDRDKTLKLFKSITSIKVVKRMNTHPSRKVGFYWFYWFYWFN